MIADVLQLRKYVILLYQLSFQSLARAICHWNQKMALCNIVWRWYSLVSSVCLARVKTVFPLCLYSAVKLTRKVSPLWHFMWKFCSFHWICSRLEEILHIFKEGKWDSSYCWTKLSSSLLLRHPVWISHQRNTVKTGCEHWTLIWTT